MMVVNTIFEIGEMVYLKTDVDQKVRIVTAVMIRAGGSVSYELSCGLDAKWFYEVEVSAERDVLKATTN